MNEAAIVPEAVISAITEGFSLMKAYRQHLGLPIQFVSAYSGIPVHRLAVLESGAAGNEPEFDAIERALRLPPGFLGR